MEDFALPRLFIFLGICILLITTVGGAAPPGWTALQDTLTHGFPTFNNPFDERLEADLRIIADGSIKPSAAFDADNVPNCTNGTNPASNFFGCVVTPDKGISYATADPTGGHQFKVNLSAAGGISASLPVLAIRTVIQCEASSDVGIDFLFYKADDVTLLAEIPTDPIHCIDGYANVTAYSVFDGPHAPASDYNNGVVKFNAQVSTKISYLRVTLIYGPTTECTSADSLAYIGCILTGALNTGIRIARTILNGLVFIGQMLFFFGTLIIQFFTGLVQAFSWLLGLDPASPMFAAPVLVKGVVGIMVFGALAYIAIEGARIVAEVIGAFIP